jgi:hypothetical protein
MENFRLAKKPFEVALLDYEMAGRREEWDTLVDRLDSAFVGNECKFIVIKAGYGLGKTYTIERIYRLYQKKELKLAVYVVKATLAGRPIRAYPGEPAKARFGLDFVTRVFKNIPLEDLKAISKKASAMLKDDSLGISELASRIFLNIAKGSKLGYSILSGQDVDRTDLKKEGLRQLKTSEDALTLLHDFQKILKASKYDNFLVLLDEFEYIPTLATTKVTVILDTFRAIFDHYGVSESSEPGAMAKIVFVFAISPGGWERIRELESSSIKRTGGGGIAPFLDRVSPVDIVNLKPLTPKETADLIAFRLKAHRKAGTENLSRLHPFTPKCVRFIAEVTQGVPRRTLQYCSILLEDASKKKKKIITSQYAKRVLEKLNLYAEIKKKTPQ